MSDTAYLEAHCPRGRDFTKKTLVMPLGEALKGIFGKKKPLKEILRENKRTITRAVRDIDREKSNLEKQEKKLIGEIKKNAKAGQMGAVKVCPWKFYYR